MTSFSSLSVAASLASSRLPCHLASKFRSSTKALLVQHSAKQSSCQLRIFRHSLSTSSLAMEKLKIAIIGQSQFAAEVYKKVKTNGHEVVGVFTIPDKNNREDPVAAEAAKDGVKVFKYKSWRKKGVVLPEVLEEYKSIDANINVMPFCSQFIPME